MGTNFSLTCSATGYPVPLITWTKDSMNLTSSTDNIIISIDDPATLSDGLDYLKSTLTVLSAELDNEGTYTCSSSNDAGTSNSTVAAVDVKGVF